VETRSEDGDPNERHESHGPQWKENQPGHQYDYGEKFGEKLASKQQKLRPFENQYADEDLKRENQQWTADPEEFEKCH
jgi:hypothetical protein